MGKLFSVLKYLKGYRKYAVLNVLFNVLFAISSAVVLLLIATFIDLMFKTDWNDLMMLAANPLPGFSFSSNYLSLVSKYFVAGLIMQSGKTEALFIICLMAFGLTFIKNICRYLAMYFIAPIRIGVVRDLRNKMYSKALDLPLSYYSEERKGDLMSRMTTDVLEIEWSIMQTLEMIFREPLTIIMLVGLMVIISPQLTLTILILLPVAAISIFIIGKSLKRSSRESKETLGNIVSMMEETLGGLKVIKAFNAAATLNFKFKESNQTFYNQTLRVYRKTDLGSPLTEIIVFAILMIVLFMGGKLVFDGKLDGALFFAYFGIASQIVPPIKQLTTAYNNIQKGVASEERIDKILSADNLIHDKPDAKELIQFTNAIEYKNVSFRYHKGDEGYVLKDINLRIEKGKMIALVGQSGSGKTTLADMLPRFYDCDKGEIFVDGINIKDLKAESLRRHIGVVTQESTLFNDTIANNIAFGFVHATKEQIEHAAKIANAHEFISQFPEGYNTNIGDRGSKLSGGQKQRISIARAVLKNPEILILDEATSALDTESEKLVQDALTNLMKSRTSIVIAHRLTTIMNADEIIVISKGEIIERGNHSQLIALNGTYKKLCDMQSFK
ncbi:MAG: antibiotic transporter ATP-binding protein [Bacteroidetes bacterium]|jgi:subfamily B ATP-binding cassette protein MsbA|nr:antibiotic transporter ATP-binding protein [Bacteroidota bacterium]